jgi:polyphenol oxidase
MKQVNFHDHVLLAYSEVADGNMDLRFGVPAEVKKNRQVFFTSLGLTATEVIEGEQIHFNRLLVLTEDNIKMWHGQNITGVDGFLTNDNTIGIMVRLADCVPVVLYDPTHRALALVHAGWKGIAAGIHTLALERMAVTYQTDPHDTVVWIGPSAKKSSYIQKEVSETLSTPEWLPYHQQKPEGTAIDLDGYILDTLTAQGIRKKHIKHDKRCTIEDKNLFSHQRSTATGEPEGRFAVIAKIR